MTTSLDRAIPDLGNLNSDASFAELQIHDKLKANLRSINDLKIPSTFAGYLSYHGEGETDGKRRIKFSSNDETERKRYIQESVNLYSFLLDSFNANKVRRLILHPDTLSRKVSRKNQIGTLAISLLEIRDKLKHRIEFVCIEPRGGDRHNKVLRADIEDIETFEDCLGHKAAKEIGLCNDVAQLYVVHGNAGIINFLDRLHKVRLPIKEFHISDVLNNNKLTNRVAMEIGTGSVNWNLILPSLLGLCNDLLIETLGGIKVYLRSKTYLESLMSKDIYMI